MKNVFSVNAIIGAVALAGSTLATAPAYASGEAEQYVSVIINQANEIFAEPDEAAGEAALKELVHESVNMRRVGLFTLGQYARQASAEQKAAFLPLFDEYASRIYLELLSDYSGERLEVTGSIDRSERDIIVNSRVADTKPGDQFAGLTVHWRVYKSRDGELSVVDAGADNVWLAIEQRSQFTSVIANNGGGAEGIDALISDLRAQLGDTE